jgi:tetratricopeptide (TPR) repeat protein
VRVSALKVAAVVLLAGAAPALAQDVAGHLEAGDAARCRRNAEEALMHYREALALDSLSYDANWKASQALTDLGKQLPNNQGAHRDSLYAEAIAFAQRAVRVNSNGADGHYMVAVATGRAALTKGPRERVRFAGVVREEALRATELNPRHDGALHVLGRWNAEIERLPGLTKFFAKTFLGASIFNQASWENSENFFHQAIELNTQNIYHHLDLAEALSDQDKKIAAIEQLQLVAQLPLGCDPMDETYKSQAAALLQRLSR